MVYEMKNNMDRILKEDLLAFITEHGRNLKNFSIDYPCDLSIGAASVVLSGTDWCKKCYTNYEDVIPIIKKVCIIFGAQDIEMATVRQLEANEDKNTCSIHFRMDLLKTDEQKRMKSKRKGLIQGYLGKCVHMEIRNINPDNIQYP